VVRQGCKLQQAGVQALELAFGYRVEVDATNALVGTKALQPKQQNLGGTRIGDCAFAQATLDLRIRRRLTLSARFAASTLVSRVDARGAPA
jgi:hypothetical protein